MTVSSFMTNTTTLTSMCYMNIRDLVHTHTSCTAQDTAVFGGILYVILMFY